MHSASQRFLLRLGFKLSLALALRFVAQQQRARAFPARVVRRLLVARCSLRCCRWLACAAAAVLWLARTALSEERRASKPQLPPASCRSNLRATKSTDACCGSDELSDYLVNNARLMRLKRGRAWSGRRSTAAVATDRRSQFFSRQCKRQSERQSRARRRHTKEQQSARQQQFARAPLTSRPVI